jgi:hypothetical protein
MTERVSTIDPRMVEAVMMGGWSSWEMAHFIDGAAGGRNDR